MKIIKGVVTFEKDCTLRIKNKKLIEYWKPGTMFDYKIRVNNQGVYYLALVARPDSSRLIKNLSDKDFDILAFDRDYNGC